MSFLTATNRAASPDLVNRRMVGGLLFSIVFHALLLLLQFGVPGLGLPLPLRRPPVRITIVPPAPVPSPVSAPSLEQLPALLPAPAPGGMRLVAPATQVVKPNPTLKTKPRPHRGSRRLAPRQTVHAPTPVIAQDQHPNDSFVVPLQPPQAVVQPTEDPKQVREGSDDGAGLRASQLAEAQRAQELEAAASAARKAEEAERELAQDAARLAAALAEQVKQQEALRQQQINEQAARQQADQTVRQQADELAVKQRAEELALRQKAEDLALRQKAEEVALTQQAQELALRQQAQELALRQKAEELALRQKAEELALRQKAEELALRQKADELAARQRADELARQQAAEEAVRQQAQQALRQQAEQAARQQAEQATRKQAEQAARQQAEQVAAGMRERERAAAAAPSAGSANNGVGAGGTGITVPKNMLGSDAGNRVRDLARGIDLLSGAPPQRARTDDDRGRRRAVVGAAERDVALRMYADSFRQKIERNGGLAFSSKAGDLGRSDPLVSVALRSDGSVEEVTIVRSSGNAETDNAVRRIVRLNARYSAFPPNIATNFDVIEVRRIWSFADSLKLLEEVR